LRARAFGESQGRLSAHVRREDPGKLSAKHASPVGLQRVALEIPLGEAFNEWKRAFTERIPALGEGPKSSSKSLHLLDISTSSEVLNEAI
jgi:hypothetical protein